MPHATYYPFPKFLNLVDDGTITSMEAADVRLMLLANTYTFDPTDVYVADLVAHEHDGAGYARVAVTSEAVADTADGTGAKFDADDATFANLAVGTNPVLHVVAYVFKTNDSDSILMGCMTLDSGFTPDGTDFNITFDPYGWYQSMTSSTPGVPTKVTYVDADSASAQKVLNVFSTAGVYAGDIVLIDHNDAGSRREWGEVDTVQDGVSVTLLANLTNTHTAAQADTVVFWNA